ncbi:MAG: RNA-binding cell elongation regulator Jag/EloR [Acidimicrobiia bacterium]
MEYVEVKGKTVDVAVEAALEELGIDRDRADIEVIQEPEKGFLGMGGKDAVVRVKARPSSQKRRRRRRKGGDDQRSGESGSGRGGESPKPRESRPERQNRGRDRDSRPKTGRDNDRKNSEEKPKKEASEVSIEEQAPVVESFLKGLVDAFGLEGAVSVSIEDDVIVADVSGPQTEAMVGPRGATIEAIHELTKTVLQRQTQASARVRLDIAGYAERRRQALAIYADQLIDQVLAEGGEVMLEPMSAGDRKTIHDAVANRSGVRSYSEGEAPQRFVVIAASGSTSEEE